MRAMVLTVLSIAFAASAGVGHSQRAQDARVFAGEYDRDFFPPRAEGAEGQKDAQAVRAIRQYLALSTTGEWQGLTARGVLSLEQDGKVPQFAASMTLDAHGRSRLDFTTSTGVRSIRMNHGIGGVLFEGGQIAHYPANVSEAGLIPTPFTLSEALRLPNAALVYDGVVEIGGAHLEKVTYTRPAVPGSRASQTSTLIPPLVTSLFFDPQTHMLLKAVDSVHLSTNEKNAHLRVFSFAGFREVQGQMIPRDFQETLDGRLSWRLSVTESRPECNQDPSYFSF